VIQLFIEKPSVNSEVMDSEMSFTAIPDVICTDEDWIWRYFRNFPHCSITDVCDRDIWQQINNSAAGSIAFKTKHRKTFQRSTSAT